MKEMTYAFLGMNRYGYRLALSIAATGAEVLIADGRKDVVDLYADSFTFAVCLDMANAAALEKIGLDQIDIVVVDLPDQLEAAIVSVMVAKEQGVKRVIATASSDRFRDVMMRVGADEVVIPYDTAAAQMAKLLISADFMTFFDIGGNLCVLKVQPRKEWVNQSLRKLQLKEKEQINVSAIELDGVMDSYVRADTVIPKDSTLVIALPKTQMYDFI